MRQQTYEALKEIHSKTRVNFDELVENLESQPWEKSDAQCIATMRLCLYYLHCPDELTEPERQRAAELYKHLENRWKIKIS